MGRHPSACHWHEWNRKKRRGDKSHVRDSVRPLAVTQLVIGMAVHRNLHALEAGMGNGFMTCKTKDQELVVPEIARIE
jgi:hypothetical protein